MANILVSGCLLGIDCRYKGDNCKDERILELSKRHTLIFVCPEQMGGLPTPREPSEQLDGRVVCKSGRDVTREFEAGAEAALKIARLNGVKLAILKERSPSCGSGTIYDGSFGGVRVPGDGVFARLLKQNGIRVLSEEELDELPNEYR